MTPEMASHKPQQASPLSILVLSDARHSYMQRVYTLAGPGAYTIPSTFLRPAPNTLLRVVQREHYGRDFARYACAFKTSCTHHQWQLAPG